MLFPFFDWLSHREYPSAGLIKTIAVNYGNASGEDVQMWGMPRSDINRCECAAIAVEKLLPCWSIRPRDVCYPSKRDITQGGG